MPTKTKSTNGVVQWQDRIQRRASVSPHILLSNPRNWRLHTPAQIRATEDSLARLGFLKPVIVRDGTNVIVDGHLRVEVAIAAGQEAIPVDYVAMSDDEELLALAALDRITEMAETDAEAYASLVEALPTDDASADLYAALIGMSPADALRSSMEVDHTAIITYGDNAVDENQTMDALQERYDSTTVRQIVLIMDVAGYTEMVPALRRIMEREELDTTYLAVRYLIEQDVLNHGE